MKSAAADVQATALPAHRRSSSCLYFHCLRINSRTASSSTGLASPISPGSKPMPTAATPPFELDRPQSENRRNRTAAASYRSAGLCAAHRHVRRIPYSREVRRRHHRPRRRGRGSRGIHVRSSNRDLSTRTTSHFVPQNSATASSGTETSSSLPSGSIRLKTIRTRRSGSPRHSSKPAS